MKKITGQFAKYTVILLIVGAVLVLIGGLSVGRKAISNQREIALDMTAKTRVDVISRENADLKAENGQLKQENSKLKEEKTFEEQKVRTALALCLAEKYIDEGNFEKAEKELTNIDKTVLSALPEEISEIYGKLIEMIENN